MPSSKSSVEINNNHLRKDEPVELGVGTDRISPAILGMLMMAGAGLMGMVAFGSLQIHVLGMEVEAQESAVFGFQQSGGNITFEEYDGFINDMTNENYYLIAGLVGGTAASGMAASSFLFLNRRRPAAEIGIAANALAIFQAQWTASIGSNLGSNLTPVLGNTYFLMGITHSLIAGCCLLFASSMILTSAGRNSLRQWGEPDEISHRKPIIENSANEEE